MLALLLGAGFSKWAADLPVASQLFDFQITPFGVREPKKLELVRRLKHRWDEEHPEAQAEQFIDHIMASGNEKSREVVQWYIVRRLSDPYIWEEWRAGRSRRHVLMIDEYRKYERPGVEKARNFLTDLRTPLAGVVTTNYDLLVEYALGTKGFNYGNRGEVLAGRGAYPVSQCMNPVTLTGKLPLAKVHGSISWDATGHFSDGRRALTGNALIVAPTPEKSPLPILERAWELSGEIFRKATQVLVFGFAFNPYDKAILHHLQTNGGNIRQVMVMDTFPQMDRAGEVWPHAEISSLPPPPGSKHELIRWIE